VEVIKTFTSDAGQNITLQLCLNGFFSYFNLVHRNVPLKSSIEPLEVYFIFGLRNGEGNKRGVGGGDLVETGAYFISQNLIKAQIHF